MITEWIETVLTTTAVCPALRDNLREELEQWVAKATEVQVSICPLSVPRCSELKGMLQDTLRAVMHIELSVNAEFEAPVAAKGLHEEVKAWLECSELFRTAQILNDEVGPTDARELTAPVESAVEVVEEIGEGVEVERAVCSLSFVSIPSRRLKLYHQVASIPNDPAKVSVPPVASLKPSANTAGQKQRLLLFSEDEEETPQKAKWVKPAKVVVQASDDE
jgi:hypothetical protein